MLYYTSTDETGNTDATYSGRFAFIHFPDYEDFLTVDRLRNENDFKQLWGSQDDPQIKKAKEILAHEYTHKRIFALSETGLMLNGYRFLVRAKYLLTGRMNSVKKYYRMRTIYLMETRPYHEHLAHAIDEELGSGISSIDLAFRKTVDSQYASTIQTQEDTIQKSWQDIGGQLPPYLRKICTRLGRWFQENFAVMHSFRNLSGEIEHGGFADQGISNDLGTARPGDTYTSRLKKFLLQHLVALPLFRKESFDSYFEWYWLGQRTQFETLQQQYQVTYDQFRDETMGRNALFIMEWAGVPGPMQSTLIQITEDTLILNRADFMERWRTTLNQWKHNPYVTRYFCFFYLHGN